MAQNSAESINPFPGRDSEINEIERMQKGAEETFQPCGMLSMMVLKSYMDCSDRRLIEYLNGSIDFQLYCGMFLGTNRITNFKIVSEIRCQLSERLKIKSLQKILAHHWKSLMQESNIMLINAISYETSKRYPTNLKLLWESIDWSYEQIVRTCKYLKIRTLRNKYLKQKEKFMNYSRKRKKTNKETTERIRSLLYLLDKLFGLLKEIEQQHEHRLEMPKRYNLRIRAIKTVLQQQQQMFEAGESISDRTVSLSKSYIRPIIRGKEVKAVEFGAKVKMIQFGWINSLNT